MITEDKVTEIFCMADDFCKFFDAMVAKYTLKPTGKRKYHRDSTMSKAEVMLIMILFHDSGYHCFKHFYLEKRSRVSMYKGLLTHSLLCFKFVELTLNNINCDINVFLVFTDITFLLLSVHSYLETMLSLCFRVKHNKTQNKFLINTI